MITPAFASLGVGFPLAPPSSFLIPRIGTGVGIAWIRAKRFPEGDSDIASSFALELNAGVSMRIYRLLRLTADGLFGSTTSRLVARDAGVHAAYWGAPFGALALRVEVQVQ
jgi:hypothetical protein